MHAITPLTTWECQRQTCSRHEFLKKANDIPETIILLDTNYSANLNFISHGQFSFVE
ncbi:hypothetical protein MPTK1_4g11100 [Marchantia polymorpha subsp. ruderalis]|uniref:Uncharacterized protein n=2 Tax=Marchantia polymorpha TaxID=3197 RepID=A0AAF6B8P5_MARPO|nr:hypothetical protein MARPO_0011s0095 [Marchantia polymorpha]BBN08379.1 hypothetical protein Mp_4g11100 [Marchantia polymorpha subsp. ruderalis]|eukprot:PTQ46415.1 hypothetical protein MARPO_0011s0095 [Marchantia polymorpha]